MSTIPLLPCRWRGPEFVPGRYECYSPKLIVSARGVTAKVCAGCYCRNHDLPGGNGELIDPPTDLSVGDPRPTTNQVVATLAVGPAGRDMLEISRPFMRRYAERCGADYHEVTVTDSTYALGEKFRLSTLLNHWSRVLFLDADVLVARDCPNLFALVPSGTVGMHDDLDAVTALAGREWLEDQHATLISSQGWTLPAKFAGCFNTGVVVFDRAHRSLFAPPLKPYPKFHTAEQNVVNARIALDRIPIMMISEEFNYQWWRHPHMEGPAFIWHYAKPVGVSEALRLDEMRARVGGRPGTELKTLLANIGAVAGVGCQCESRAAQMDRWGVEGCREHRSEIVAWLKEQWDKLGWADRAKAVFNMVRARHAHVTDPFGAVVDEAIERAAAKRTAEPSNRTPSVDTGPPILQPQPLADDRKRHLLFHIMPVAGTPAWRLNCDHLIAHMGVFTGRRICGIVTASNRCKRPLDPPEAVREYLGPHGFEFVEVPNDYRLREVVTWKPMWDKLDATDRDLIFYCHSKGTTKPYNPGVTCHAWGRVMYDLLLGQLPAVERLLATFPIVGLFPKTGRHFANSRSQWHYSGSFYWMRAAEALDRKGPEKIDRTWFGVESWPGLVFLPDEVGCLHDPKETDGLDMYQMGSWRDKILPMIARWTQENESGRLRDALQALGSGPRI